MRSYLPWIVFMSKQCLALLKYRAISLARLTSVHLVLLIQFVGCFYTAVPIVTHTVLKFCCT